MDGPHSQPGFSLTTEKLTLIHQRMSDAFIFNGSYADKEEPAAEIIWSTDHFNPRQIVALGCHHLPAILCVETGFFGGGNIDCIASGQVVVIQGIYRQLRVLALPLKEQGLHFSLPVLGYHHTFMQSGVRHNGEPSAAKGSTLDVLLKAHQLPVAVRFADNKLHQQYGDLTLVKQYYELYLYGHNIADGSICLPMTVIPVYLDITLSTAEGVVNGNANDWHLLKDAYIHESKRLLKDVIIRGYMDMASFDSTWQQRDSSERPKSARTSRLEANDQIAEEGEEDGSSGDSSDEDDHYSYVMPSKYIKICVDLSAEDSVSQGNDDEMIQVEGTGGILSLTLSSAARLTNSGPSGGGGRPGIGSTSNNNGGAVTVGHSSATLRPPISPRPLGAKPSIDSSRSAASPPNDSSRAVATIDRGRRGGSGSPGRVAASDKPDKPLPPLPPPKLPPLLTTPTLQESAAVATVTPNTGIGASHREPEPPPAANRSPDNEAPPELAPRVRQPSCKATDHASLQRQQSGSLGYTKPPPGRRDATVSAARPAAASSEPPAAQATPSDQVVAPQATITQPLQQKQVAMGQQQTAAIPLATAAPTSLKVRAITSSASAPHQSDDDSDHDGYVEIDDVEDIARAHLVSSRSTASAPVSKVPSDGGCTTNLPGSGADPGPVGVVSSQVAGLASAALAASRQAAASERGITLARHDAANLPLPFTPVSVHRSISVPDQSLVAAHSRTASSHNAGRSASESGSSCSSSSGAGSLQVAAQAVPSGSATVPSGATPSLSPALPTTLSDVPAGDLSALTNEQLCRCLRLLGMGRCADSFEQDAMIDGVLLMELAASDLCGHFGFTEFEAKKIIMFAHGWRPRLR